MEQRRIASFELIDLGQQMMDESRPVSDNTMRDFDRVLCWSMRGRHFTHVLFGTCASKQLHITMKA